MAADRYSINKSWDHVQSRFVGTGHGDMTKFEWGKHAHRFFITICSLDRLINLTGFRMHQGSNQHRDTIASHVGHYDMLSFFAVAQNDSIGRVRYQLLEVYILIFHFPTHRLTPFVDLLQKMLQPCGPPPAKDEDVAEGGEDA